MDRYKKKNMKFMGKGPEVRAAEMNAARRSVRQQRFSLQRPLEDMDQQNNNQSKVTSLASKVPTLGIPKPQSRLEMLNKWKAEKELKKRLELNSKKPVFKVGPSRPQLDATASSRLQALKASRIQPVSKLADITHQKNISLRPDTKAIIKPVQTRSIPSTKPQITRLQVNEAKIAPTTKPQIGKPQATKVYSSAPSNFKPQSNTGMKVTKNLPSDSKPQNNSVKESKVSNSTKPVAVKSANKKEEKKIPTTGIRPPTLPPLRRPQLQNQQNKSKPISIVPSTKAVAKAVEKPLNREPEVKNTSGSSLDKRSQLPSWPLSVIEDSAKEKSFAPEDFVFCPPKIRSSWLDNEGMCTILSRVMKEMNLKPRTSTPLKKELLKHQELESSFDKEDSTNTGESSNGVPEPTSSDVEKQEPETLLEKEAENKGQSVMNEIDISVFYPSEPAAVAPQKSKRLFSSCWKMEKPSLALISESPENFKELPQTPKSHRRRGLLAEEFTPRRSQRLARKSELKEDNIFEVKECFLDSPSVEAASRMSMRPYDFDRLHLEASALQGNSNGAQSTRSNRGKVSLLYTPPRLRASTRNKSLKGDLMTFSPNVE